MQGRRYMWIGLTILLAWGLGVLLAAKRTNEPGPEVVRTYQIENGRAEELRQLCKFLFSTNNDGGRVANVQVMGSDLLVVRASEGIQSGVADLINKTAKQAPSKDGAVRLDYYLVTGRVDKAGDSTSFPPALQTALSAITKVDGARKFRLIEHVSSTVLDGFEAEVAGWMVQAKSFVGIRNGQINLRIEFNTKLNSKIKSETQVKPGDYLILGETALAPDTKIEGEAASDGSTNVYYIVHAEIVK